MTTIERSTIINVPVDRVFRYLREPTSLSELCPNLIDLTDVLSLSESNKRFTWTYKMLGVRFLGRAEVQEIAHNRRLEYRFWGGISACLVWTFQPVETGVSIVVRADYEAPKPLLRGYLEETITKQNVYCIESMMTQLKTRLESELAIS